MFQCRDGDFWGGHATANTNVTLDVRERAVYHHGGGHGVVGPVELTGGTFLARRDAHDARTVERVGLLQAVRAPHERLRERDAAPLREDDVPRRLPVTVQVALGGNDPNFIIDNLRRGGVEYFRFVSMA